MRIRVRIKHIIRVFIGCTRWDLGGGNPIGKGLSDDGDELARVLGVDIFTRFDEVLDEEPGHVGIGDLQLLHHLLDLTRVATAMMMIRVRSMVRNGVRVRSMVRNGVGVKSMVRDWVWVWGWIEVRVKTIFKSETRL